MDNEIQRSITMYNDVQRRKGSTVDSHDDRNVATIITPPLPHSTMTDEGASLFLLARPIQITFPPFSVSVSFVFFSTYRVASWLIS